jgi:uncharacterized protein
VDFLGDAFLLFVLVGFVAQLVDGALGMAYGLVSSTVLLSTGLPPATASAAVHAAEVVTTGISGASHYYHRNIDKRLFLSLAIPGAVGGAIGAYFLANVPGDKVKPYILCYLIVLGVVVLVRAFGKLRPREVKRASVLGFIGGLLDAIGGGGWGPITTSTLLARGRDPRTAIGSVNAAEFVVTLAISATFLTQMGPTHINVVAGLLVGGACAAPLAAWLVRHLPARTVMASVAIVVLALSGWQLSRVLAS